MRIKVKICGLNGERGLSAAVENKASYVGFVFYRRSPRFISTQDAAAFVASLPRRVKAVGLFVNPSDSALDAVLNHVRLDMVQLHGRETPERVDDVRAAYGLPVMKAIGVSSESDLRAAQKYEDHADWLLFDAKPPKSATRPGGNATSFDWALMKSYLGKTPWMLAGGLTPRNVAKAIQLSGARAVDVSSGVETRPGLKSPAKIRSFLNAAKAAAHAR